MPHQRQLIREAVKAQLLNQTVAAARVYETRMFPLKRGELPGIGVYVSSEAIDPRSRNSAPRNLDRSARLQIEGWVKAGTNVEDAMDAFALEIEKAMNKDPTLGGTAGDSVLSETVLTVATEGDQPVGMVQLTYAVTYDTYVPDSDVVLDDLQTVNIRTNLGGQVHATNQAQDQLEDLDQ